MILSGLLCHQIGLNDSRRAAAVVTACLVALAAVAAFSSCTTVRHALGMYDILTAEEAVLVNEVNEFTPGGSKAINVAFVQINGDDPSASVIRRLQRRCHLRLQPASSCINTYDSMADDQRLTIMDSTRHTYGILIRASADSTYGDTTVVDASYYAGPLFGRWRTYGVTKRDHRWIIRKIGWEIISDLSPRSQRHSRV